jgi:2-polyprenyl-3-methyl-5-hydroxy-6-metoxy-1,4-benzoquinol methylase
VNEVQHSAGSTITDNTAGLTVTPPDPELLMGFVEKAVGDLGGALAVPLVLIGDRLGLFRAMVGRTQTSVELAERTNLTERYVREWLLAMAAAAYIRYDGDERFSLSPEQAEALTNEDSPGFVAGGFQNMSAGMRSVDRLTEAFRTGDGMGWHEHHPDMFVGTERFFRPGYLANLTSSWIPGLTGAQAALEKGIRVADVGCGLGASTRILAEAYPNSSFMGVDYHAESIELARARALEAGLSDRIEFSTGGAAGLAGQYDLIAFFDCLHDMPDPMSALTAARSAVTDDGWVMLVEPAAGDTIEDALNPIGRVFAGASVMICLPSGLSGEPRAGLGNQAGPRAMFDLAREAGFRRFREAVRTPFNVIYELRP